MFFIKSGSTLINDAQNEQFEETMGRMKAKVKDFITK